MVAAPARPAAVAGSGHDWRAQTWLCSPVSRGDDRVSGRRWDCYTPGNILADAWMRTSMLKIMYEGT